MKKKKLSLTEPEKKRLLELLGAFQKTHILVIGDFILDQFVWGNVSRISPEAPVPVVNVKRESYMPGGSLNVASNIRSLGGTVYPCGVLGRDLEGRALVKIMRREEIETGGVIYDKGRPTSLKTRIIAHSQQVVRFDREKSEDIPQADLRKILKFVRSKIASMDVVVIEDYGKGLIQPFFAKEIIALAKKYKKPVLVDPKEKHFSYYEGATVITPNRLEATAGYEGLFGANGRSPDIEKIGWKLLRKLKLDSVLMTLGEDGMALFEKAKKVVRIPTTAKEVYDVSGAGDTVIATLALSLAVKAGLKDAAKLANVAAGIVVGKLGTATITPAELRQAIRSFKS